MIRRLVVIMAAALSVTACSDARSAGEPGPSASGPARLVWTYAETAQRHEEFVSVTALGSDDAWAVGGASDGGHALVKHWDGRRWLEVPAPGKTNLAVVSASSSSDVWVFDQEGQAWRREGDGWADMGRLGGLSRLRTALVAGPGEVWVAGIAEDGAETPLVGRWSGGRWSAGSAPLAISWLSAVSPREVWAVGVGADDRLSVVRWDGERWHAVPVPAEIHVSSDMGMWDRIVAVTPHQVWATGRLSAEVPQAYNQGFVLRWDGSGWLRLAAPSSGAFDAWIASVRCFGVLAADGRGGAWLAVKGRIWHHDGLRWSAERSPHPDFDFAYDITRIPGTRQAIAVGGRPLNEEDGDGWIWMRR